MTFENLTLDDRRRLSRAAWCRPDNNRDGMCSGCGYAFRGIGSFDRHFDKAGCRHPTTVTNRKGRQVFRVATQRLVDGIEVPIWTSSRPRPANAPRRVSAPAVRADSPPPVPEQGSRVADVTGEAGR